jgi:hypothetical protein
VLTAIIAKMGHNLGPTLKDYWSTQEEFYMGFHKNVVKQNRSFHLHGLMILRYSFPCI